MAGNVREWCRDVYAEYTGSDKPTIDPQGPEPPQGGKVDYVIRGGSFRTYADQNHTTRPRHAQKDEVTGEQLADNGSADDVGFRVVLEWPPRP